MNPRHAERLLLAADGLAMFGSWIDFLALLTLAAYRFEVTGFEMALFSAASLLPGVLLGPWLGRRCDAGPTRRLLLGAIALRMAATVAVLLCRDFTLLMLLVALRSSLTAVVAPAVNVLAVRSVAPARRVRFYSLLNVLNSSAKVVAPAVGTAASSLAGESFALGVGLVLALASLLLFSRVPMPAAPSDAPVTAVMGADTREDARAPVPVDTSAGPTPDAHDGKQAGDTGAPRGAGAALPGTALAGAGLSGTRLSGAALSGAVRSIGDAILSRPTRSASDAPDGATARHGATHHRPASPPATVRPEMAIARPDTPSADTLSSEPSHADTTPPDARQPDATGPDAARPDAARPAHAAPPTLAALVAITATWAFFVFMVNNLMPLVLQRAGFDKSLLGALVGCSGAGNVLAGLWLARHATQRPLRGRLVELTGPAALAAGGFGVIGAVLKAQPPGAGIWLGLVFFVGGTFSARFGVAQSVCLATHHAAAFGRASATLQAWQNAMMLAAPLLGAVVLERYGPAALFFVAALAGWLGLAVVHGRFAGGGLRRNASRHRPAAPPGALDQT